MNFKEGEIGALGTNTSCFDGYFNLKRVNRDKEVLVVSIMNRNRNILDMTSDVVFNDDVSNRPDVFVYRFIQHAHRIFFFSMIHLL